MHENSKDFGLWNWVIKWVLNVGIILRLLLTFGLIVIRFCLIASNEEQYFLICPEPQLSNPHSSTIPSHLQQPTSHKQPSAQTSPSPQPPCSPNILTAPLGNTPS